MILIRWSTRPWQGVEQYRKQGVCLSYRMFLSKTMTPPKTIPYGFTHFAHIQWTQISKQRMTTYHTNPCLLHTWKTEKILMPVFIISQTNMIRSKWDPSERNQTMPLTEIQGPVLKENSRNSFDPWGISYRPGLYKEGGLNIPNTRVCLIGKAALPRKREEVWEGKAWCLIRKPEERMG